MRSALSFSIILYLLFLLMQPCQDVFAADGGNEVGHNTAHAPMPADEENSDACSPFCICSCCSTGLAYYPLIGIEPPARKLPVIEKPAIGHNDPFIGSYQNSIWQPPKA